MLYLAHLCEKHQRSKEPLSYKEDENCDFLLCLLYVCTLTALSNGTSN